MNQGNKEADWSTNSKTPPTCRHPLATYWLPTSFTKKRERALLPLVTTASGRKGCSPPLVSFNTPTVSHSAEANQVSEQYLWNFLEKEKKQKKQKENDDDRGDRPIRWPDLKNKQEVGGASKPHMELFFWIFLFVFVLFVRVCEPYIECSSDSSPSADFSAMHHGTINR